MASNLPLDWSGLIPDVLSSVYERLSFADFARARTVCSSWYSVSTPRKNHVPWLIFKQNKYWKLFDPEEGKFYKAQINHFGFKDFRSLATCGSWVLLLDKKAYFYIVNPFTSKVIRLPPLEYQTSENKILSKYSIHFDYGFAKGRFEQDCGRGCCGRRLSVIVKNAVLWVDERTKDYLVAWTCWASDHLYFGMTGDQEWFETPNCEYLKGREKGGRDMAYKDKKLYILSEHGRIGILDFSQGFPRDIPNNSYVNPLSFHTKHGKTRMKLTTSGDVVLMAIKKYPSIRFGVYKMNNISEEWEIVDSLEEEEAFVWDLSVTLPTKGVSGIKKDTVYFCYEYENVVATYEVPTQKTERFEQCSHLLGVENVRWFLPCFGVGD